MVSRLIEVIERHDTTREQFDAGAAHLFIWAERGSPDLRLSVDAASGRIQPIGSPPPKDAVAKTELMVADLMDRAETDPTIIDDWRAERVVLVLSADGVRVVPAGVVQSNTDFWHR
jgi:hypothetical protein